MKIIGFVILSILLVFTFPVHGIDRPQGNFVLAGGKYRATDEADPFEKMDRAFFSSIIVPVKDGKIDFSTTSPIDTESGKQHFTGEMNFSLNGTYDKDTGAIHTNFSQSSNYSYERKTDSGTRDGKGGFVFVGSAKGTVLDNQVVLSFEGKLSDKASSEADDKSVDNSSTNGLTWTKKVAFGTSEWVVQDEQVEETTIPGRDSGARASDLSGQVEIACPPHLDSWDVMKMGRVIYVDCHIKPGEDSKAVISFSDMTTFVIKPESEIVIDTPPEKDSKMKLLAGNIWVNVKKMVKDGTMEVHMGQAVAGIKGTTFVLEETKDTSILKVIEGRVAFKSIKTNEEKYVNAGETVTGTTTGLREVGTFDVASENLKWTGYGTNVKTTNETDTQPNSPNEKINVISPQIYLLIISVLVITGFGIFGILKYSRKRS